MWKNVGEIFTNLVAGIYRTVVRNYNMMVDFTSDPFTGNSEITAEIEKFTDKLFTLVAVFMLFRITISLIEYLVNPDKISDNSVGASKMVNRIIVAIGLVISFPFLKDQVYKLQTALLEPGSILQEIFNNSGSSSGSSMNELSNESGIRLLSFDDSFNQSLNITSNINNEQKEYNVIFIADEVDPCKSTTWNEAACLEILKKETGGKQNTINRLAGGPMSETIEALIEDAFNCTINYTDRDGNSITDTDTIISQYIYSALYKTNRYGNNAECTIKLTSNEEEAAASEEDYDEGEYYNPTQQDTDQMINASYKDIVDPGLSFAYGVLGSFLSVPDGSSASENCLEEEEFLKTTAGDDAIAKMVEEKEIELDLFMAIVCGIVLIIVILILCIEVIIRSLKLVVLEILAPIAFMSYVNPNDKVLSSWFKKFMGTYLELFIKILAINMGVFFISRVDSFVTEQNAIQKLLFYLAAFLFMKTVPNFIADILGIKDMGGSFKETAGALKTAAFTGAGAVAGGAIGLASGMGKGGSFLTATGGLLGGIGRGAAGGAKGNLLQGANDQRTRNIRNRSSNLAGGSLGGRLSSGFDRFFGHEDKFERAESKYNASNEALTSHNDFEDYAIKQSRKDGDTFGISALEQAQSILNNGGQITDDITYIDKNLDQKTLSKGANINEVGAALGDAKKGAVQAYATALGNDGIITRSDGKKITLSSLGTRAFDNDGKEIVADYKFDASKAEEGNNLLHTATTLFSKAGYEGSYAADVDKAKDVASKTKAASKSEMEANRSDHNAANNNSKH